MLENILRGFYEGFPNISEKLSKRFFLRDKLDSMIILKQTNIRTIATFFRIIST